jgi:hypothetical protein
MQFCTRLQYGHGDRHKLLQLLIAAKFSACKITYSKVLKDQLLKKRFTHSPKVENHVLSGHIAVKVIKVYACPPVSGLL